MKTRTLSIATAALCIAASSVLSACGGSDATSSGNEKDITVGMISFSQANKSSNGNMVGLKDYADSQGWKTILIDAQGQPDKAIGAMQDLVSKKVDVIVYSVFPAQAVAAGAIRAKAAGIPVATFGGGLGDGVQATWDFGEAEGKDSAAQVMKDLGGKGDLLALGYSSGGPCTGRVAAMKDALSGTSIKATWQEVPIPGQVQGGQQFAQAWLAAHPKGSGPLAIWGCFDEPVQGAIAALKAAGRDDVSVYGLDGNGPNLRAMVAGEQDGDVWIDPTGSGEVVGKAIPKIIENGVNGDTIEDVAPYTVLDKNNIQSFVDQHADALDE